MNLDEIRQIVKSINEKLEVIEKQCKINSCSIERNSGQISVANNKLTNVEKKIHIIDNGSYVLIEKISILTELVQTFFDDFKVLMQKLYFDKKKSKKFFRKED